MGEDPRLVGDSAVHPTAVFDDGSDLDRSAQVGAFCHIGRGVVIGAGSVIAEHVIVGADVVIGERTTISSGAYLMPGVVVGDDVVIGPNAAFVAEHFHDEPSSAPTMVRSGAGIGANATVLAGVTIGPGARVGAGSLVTRDVPPYATVVGSPARIVGYESSPQFTAARRLRSSVLADEEFPVRIGRTTLHKFPRVEDLRGALTFGEFPSHLPFAPHRYFIVYDVPSREVRGEHAHRALHQLLVCVHGECAVSFDDGTARGEVMLDRPDAALHLPEMVWASQYRYSRDAVLFVLASATYDEADYIRNYDDFVAEVGRV